MPMQKIFQNRVEAGRLLAKRLASYANRDDTLILALPRGGVPVAFEVALALHLPMDVLIVRKLGAPGQEELAMGAVASGGVLVLNQAVVQELDINAEVIQKAETRERKEVERRERIYRDDLPPPHVENKTVLLIDDGIATGSTMEAAIQALRQQKPRKIVVGAPTVAASTYRKMKALADEVIAITTPEIFFGVGQWYREFGQTSDEEVIELLQSAREEYETQKKQTATP